MKLTKSQIKELIRHSIRELTSEREDVTESKQRRYTVKEVRMWMKKLEENRYKKVYNSDARRVAWMVNNEGVELSEGKLQQAMKQWKYLEKTLTPHKKKFINKRLKSLKPKMDKYFKNKDYQDYIDGELSIKVPLPDLMFGKGKEFGQLISAYSNAIKEPEYYKFDEGKLTETKFYAFFNKKKHTIDGKSLYDAKQKAITKLKVPKSKVGLLAIVNAKEHDRGGFRFEQKLRESIREIIKEQLNLNEYIGAGKPIPRNKAKQLFVPENEMIRFSRVFKKLIQKGFVYIGDQAKEKKKISKHYTITVDKKMYNNLLDILMSKRFKVKT